MTYSGAELDLLVIRGSRRLGFEAKLTEAPSITRSMRVAIDDLGLSQLYLVHAGEDCYPLAENIRALPANRLVDELRPLPR